MKKIVVLMMVGMICFSSCKKNESSFQLYPQIYYQNATPNTINTSDSASVTTIVFRFTDGDGDLAKDPSDSVESIFIRDSRDTSSSIYTYAFPFPYIEEDIRPEGGLEGTVTLHIGRQYYRTWDSLHVALRKDTMSWSIYIKDLAGNKSNVITTGDIFIQY